MVRRLEKEKAVVSGEAIGTGNGEERSPMGDED